MSFFAFVDIQVYFRKIKSNIVLILFGFVHVSITTGELISSDEAVKLSRLIVAQGSLDPSFGQYFYEAGPKRVLAGMEALLRGAHERGLLRIDNPLRAAEHFFCLVKGAPDYRLLLGCAGPLQSDAAEAHVREVVGVFLRAFQP